MKKLMKSLMLFAAAAMALTSCENEAMNEGIEANDTFTLSFTADAPESKTSVTIKDNVANFDWSEGDQVAFVQWANGANKINKKKSEAAVIAANGSATFTSEFDSVDGAVTSYDYAAIYPDANWKSNTDFSEVTAVVPSTQTLTDNTYDPAADLMMSKAILDVANKDGHGGKLVFHRLAAIGRMNLKGIPAGEIIQTVTITFEEAVLNGDVTINFTNGTAAYATTGSNVVTLNNGNLTAVTENPIFFTCFPGEYTGAYTFDVETDKAYYQKTGTINAEKPLTFTAGNVMGFSTTVAKTADKATDKVYTKVTKNNLADYSGEYLLVYEEGGIAFDGSLTTLDAANNGFVVTISDNTITGDYTAKAFTIEKVEGGYSIKSASNKYIGSDTNTGNKLYTAEEYDASYLNTIENLIIKGSAGAPLQYNSNSSDNRFRYYYKAAQQSIALYRDNDTGSDVVLVRALESIEVTGATTTFTVNDEFVFDGTVTAKYNDNTTETVDAVNYTVDSSDVKMDTAGDYTVTVTYEGKTATYTITVNEEQQSGDVVAGWVKISALSELAAGDKVALVGTVGTTNYSMKTNGTSSAPTAQTVTINGNTLASVDGITTFNIGKSGSNYILYEGDATSTWLYCTNANNGVRSGTNTNKTWVIASHSNNGSNFEFKHIGSSRFLGIYNKADWRCYTTVNADNFTNDKGTSDIAIYKYTTGSGSDIEEPTVVAPTITINDITDVPAASVTANETVGLGSPVGDWTYTVSSDATWLSDMSLSDGKVYYTAAANTGAERTATVTITASCTGQTDVTKTFTITQEAGTGGGGVVGETYSYDVTSKIWSAWDTGAKCGNYTWTPSKVSVNGSPAVGAKDSNGRGQQFGAASPNQIKSMTMTCSDYSGGIKSIDVKTCAKNGNTVTVNVTVGGVAMNYTTNSATIANGAIATLNFTSDTALTGDIVITYSLSTAGALYVSGFGIN